MQVRDIMTPDPVCCSPGTKLTQVARIMCEQDCGEIPVLENGKPVGVVTDRDIVCRVVAQGQNAETMTAKDCMSSPAVTLTQDVSLEDCCNLLEEYQIRRIPIVDATGDICGIVSQADIARRGPETMTAAVVREVSRPTNWASAG